MKRLDLNRIAVAALAAAALMAFLAAGPAAAQEATETSTIGPVSLDDPGTYPTTETLGTFNFATSPYITLLGATISGDWGISPLSPNTAPGNYYVGNVLVFTCNPGDSCWGSNTETPWSYTFTASDLAALESGDVNFTAYQTGLGQVQADTTTLSLDVYVPEPASMALFATSLLGLGLLMRRARA